MKTSGQKNPPIGKRLLGFPFLIFLLITIVFARLVYVQVIKAPQIVSKLNHHTVGGLQAMTSHHQLVHKWRPSAPKVEEGLRSFLEREIRAIRRKLKQDPHSHIVSARAIA